jgi:DNA-binding MarR family transcriptional regulator
MSMIEADGRRRNTILAALVLLRRLAPDITVSEMLAFLYVAENPGVRVKELAVLMSTTAATASRASRALLEAGAAGALPPGRGWLMMASNGREAISRHLYLTEDGTVLAQRLDQLIISARPIGPEVAPRTTPTRTAGIRA